MFVSRSLVALIFACLVSVSPTAGEDGPQLVHPGGSVEHELAPGEEHTYRVAPGVDGPLRLVVEQHGVDVEIGTEDAVADGPFDRRFAEAVLLEGREFVLRGREPGAPAGRYVLRLEAIEGEVPLAAARAEKAAAEIYSAGTAEGWRRAIEDHRRAEAAWRKAKKDADAARHLYARAVLLRLVDETETALDVAEEARAAFRRLADPASEAYAHNELGLGHWRLGDLREARAAFHRTASLADIYDDRYLLAAASANLCLMHLTRGEIPKGRACYEDALPVIEAAGYAAAESGARTNLGRLAERAGEPGEALGHYRRALEIQSAAGDRQGQAMTLNNLGVLHRGLGNFDEAMTSYSEALEIFEASGRRRWQARTLMNIGYSYLVVRDRTKARIAFSRAQEIFRQTEDERGEADALENLGLVGISLRQPGLAVERLQNALSLRRRLGERRAEAVTLRRLGRAFAMLGETEAARARLREAAALSSELGDLLGENEALRELGALHLRVGQIPRARRELERALELADASGRRQSRVLILLDLAELELADRVANGDADRVADGESERAHDLISEALRELEDIRAGLESRELRESYSDLLQRGYRLELERLMGAHRSAPSAGYDAEALEVLERFRARSFLELLRESRIDLSRKVAPELGGELLRLKRQVQAKTERLLEMEAESELRSKLEAELLSLNQRLGALERELRERSTHYAEITQPPPVEAKEIQALVGRDEALAVYFLGERESYLWRVTENEIRSYILPARSEIERLVRQVYGSWSEGRIAGSDARRDVEELADMLRIDELADRERLGLILDGALQILPFSALPAGGGKRDFRTLSEAVEELVVLPSAAVLSHLRESDGVTTTGDSRAIAILADPSFGGDHPALPGSRYEARKILEIVGEDQVSVAFGENATRERLKSGDFQGHLAVHIATHGLIDVEQPMLSHLAVSDGLVSLQDIFDLQLETELVVLSGCRTALGKEIRGEGLIGLVRGFLYAGSSKVLASLWQVDDRATAELMGEFYRALWEESSSPASALVKAQRSMSRRPRYRNPYYWAGFVLIGDWG